MMSQGSSCSGSKGRKKARGVLTTDDIAECKVRPLLPMVGCPYCGDHQKVSMRISESRDNPGAYYVKCDRQGQSKCYFYKWLHQYAVHLQEIGEPDPYNILPIIEELHRNKLASEGEVNQEPMMNRGHHFDLITLQGKLRETLLQQELNGLQNEKKLKELRDALEKQEVNGLQNEKKLKELRDALEKANARGRMWFFMFLLCISCFAVFLGAGTTTS